MIFPTSWISPTSWNQSAQTTGQNADIIYTGQREQQQQQRPLWVLPAFVGVRLPDALGRLEGVEGVGEVHVRVGLVHQLVQRQDGLHHAHLGVRAAAPLGVLRPQETSLMQQLGHQEVEAVQFGRLGLFW